MRSNVDFIVKPLGGNRYDNVREVDGKDYYLNTSIEDAAFTQRLAEVVSTPSNYNGGISKGDTVVVHHNVFRLYYDIYGKEKSTASHFKDDMFFVEESRIYLFKGDDNEWRCNLDFCFIRPIENDNELDPTALKEYWGEVCFDSDGLSDMDVYKDDIVSFQPECEYEFDIDGETVYRMYTKNICLKK